MNQYKAPVATEVELEVGNILLESLEETTPATSENQLPPIPRSTPQ